MRNPTDTTIDRRIKMTTVQNDTLRGRLPLVDPTAVTDEQQGLFDLLSNTLVAWAKSVDVQTATEDGRLIGPFNPALYSPRDLGEIH
jgi:4-carboxymuconolactone decarboxylase